MKIRIKANSIRYRLGQSEVARFAKIGYLEERTEFPGGEVFIYRLERKAGLVNPEAELLQNRITLFIPEMTAANWAGSEQVGFDHRISLGEGKELFLLVEKDFVCLDHTFEDQSDNYPNPNKVC